MSKRNHRWTGIGIGALVSLGSGLIYLLVLKEPGSLFYLFAGLTFLGGPLVGGTFAGINAPGRGVKAFFGTGSLVFGFALALFIVAYGVLPEFDRASIQLPASCDGYDGTFDPPAQLGYTLPGGGAGLLIVGDEDTAVVATIASQGPPYATTVTIIHKADNRILQTMTFPNDVVSAAIGKGVVYIYNDKLGFFFDAHTGSLEDNIFTIDNYGGLSQTDRPVISGGTSGNWYLETSAVISSWNKDGSVISRPHLTFNGIALGCYISGNTNGVIQF